MPVEKLHSTEIGPKSVNRNVSGNRERDVVSVQAEQTELFQQPQAFSQACAVCSAFSRVLSATGIVHYQQGSVILSNGEGQSCTLATTGATEVTGVACGGLYLHTVGPRPRDHRRCNGDRELGSAVYRGADRAAIEEPNRGGDNVTAREDNRKGGRYL